MSVCQNGSCNNGTGMNILEKVSRGMGEKPICVKFANRTCQLRGESRDIYDLHNKFTNNVRGLLCDVCTTEAIPNQRAVK